MKIKSLISTGIVAVATLASVAFATPVNAITCPTGSVNGEADTLAGCNIDKSDNDLIPTVATIINVIVGVVGLAAVIVIVLGGVTFVTSAGDPAKIKKAKDTILYGVIGLIVSLLAYAIVNFVTGSMAKGSGGGSGPSASTSATTGSTT